MAKLEINGRTAELVLDMTSWEQVEEEVGRLDEIDDLMQSRQRLKNIRAIAAIMAAEGARLGRGEEMPAEWIRENCPPKMVMAVSGAIRLAIIEGMRMESGKEDNESGAVDAAMAEIEKKGTQDA